MTTDGGCPTHSFHLTASHNVWWQKLAQRLNAVENSGGRISTDANARARNLQPVPFGPKPLQAAINGERDCHSPGRPARSAAEIPWRAANNHEAVQQAPAWKPRPQFECAL